MSQVGELTSEVGDMGTLRDIPKGGGQIFDTLSVLD